jgi:crotonobetainyl-CoA:carnitine CoA-transferase CaiB-like acyl-CoA transferase
VPPLEGVTVVDATRLLPGGYCTMILAELGANVVKVEQPGLGDYMRFTPPLFKGRSPVHSMVNKGKRSIGLDLKTRAGKEAMRRLLAKADVFVEGFRPGAMRRLGFTFDEVKRINRRIVYCSISSYGQKNPLSAMPGHDINFQSMSGALGDIRSPNLPLVQLGDLSSAMYATVGILAALARRRKRGAVFIDVPIVQSLVSWLVIPVSAYMATRTHPTQGHSLVFGSDAHYNLYRTSDGKFMAVAAIEGEFWHNLLTHMGLRNPQQQREGTRKDRSRLRKKLEEKFATKTRDEWARLLMGKETCATPVLGIEEVLGGEWMKSSALLSKVEGDPLEVLSFPVGISPGRAPNLMKAPDLGEHTDILLRGMGYSPSEIKKMKGQGAVQ